MACICGDIRCSSCGPAQGNFKCWICGKWNDEGCIEHTEEMYQNAANDEEFQNMLMDSFGINL